MNEIFINISFSKQICDITGINLITGDYNSTKLKFTFDKEGGTKLFKMKNPNDETIFTSEIINNEVVLVGLTENNELASLFKSAGDYPFEVALYEDDSRLTSVFNVLSVMEEQVPVDGGEEIVVFKPLFDQMIAQLNNALIQVDNVDINVSKTRNVATVTIENSQAQSKSVDVYDGDSGITVFKIVGNDLIATSESGSNLTNYSLVDGHLMLTIGE